MVALSPWCTPFLTAPAKLSGISAPVEYQGGTLDFGITPSVRQRGGCYDVTPAPAEFVEFRGAAGHLAWTDLGERAHSDMIFYARAFFDTWLRGRPQDERQVKRDDTADLRVK